MSENIQDKWDKFSKEATKKFKELEELGSNWINDYDELENAAHELVNEVKKEMESSSMEVRKLWQTKLVEASVERKKLRLNLEKRLEAVKRSETHLERAIEELKK